MVVEPVQRLIERSEGQTQPRESASGYVRSARLSFQDLFAKTEGSHSRLTGLVETPDVALAVPLFAAA